MHLILSKSPTDTRSPSVNFMAAVFFCFVLLANGEAQTEQTGPSELAVIVLDESQLPVPGASVEIKLRDHLIFAASTDETGHSKFACKPGQYNIAAAKEGFETAVVTGL